MKKIKILLADDRLMAREGLCRLIESAEELECVGVAEDGQQAIELARKLKPDVAVIDVAMPKVDGIQVIGKIKALFPEIATLVVSAYKYDHYVLSCIAAGANGYILKENLHDKRLVNAIRMVNSGQNVFDNEATGDVLSKLANTRFRKKLSPSELGKRELEILELATKGMSSKEIATKLGIGERTVGTHFANIFSKLGVESRMEAALYAIKKGWISVDGLSLD